VWPSPARSSTSAVPSPRDDASREASRQSTPGDTSAATPALNHIVLPCAGSVAAAAAAAAVTGGPGGGVATSIFDAIPGAVLVDGPGGNDAVVSPAHAAAVLRMNTAADVWLYVADATMLKRDGDRQAIAAHLHHCIANARSTDPAAVLATVRAVLAKLLLLVNKADVVRSDAEVAMLCREAHAFVVAAVGELLAEKGVTSLATDAAALAELFPPSRVVCCSARAIVVAQALRHDAMTPALWTSLEGELFGRASGGDAALPAVDAETARAVIATGLAHQRQLLATIRDALVAQAPPRPVSPVAVAARSAASSDAAAAAGGVAAVDSG
jgi:hypothetical protein